jgi:glycosyltransferase involved in cell wall biosynthesis
VDRFDELSDRVQAKSGEVLRGSTGAALVSHLLASASDAVGAAARKPQRIMVVVNGDGMVLRNGSSRVVQAQLRYLNAAGHDVVGLFLTYRHGSDASDLATWHASLAEAIRPFSFERVFIAGSGGCSTAPQLLQAIDDERQPPEWPLRAEFDLARTFSFGGEMLSFLRDHPIDAVLLNYITNHPVIEALGLTGSPVICEMHDLQSLQRAIYGNRPVDADDLDEEFRWLSRCDALISLSERETAVVRERLPEAVIETGRVFLPDPPPALQSLAGVRDLAEIIALAKPAPEVDVSRLVETGFIDLLFVSSNHLANASGLAWFLHDVYEPYLAGRRVSLAVAGTIAGVGGLPDLPNVFYLGPVETLAPLYAATRIVILPIVEGAGSPVKTFEALAYGKPVVGTSHAFRGLEADTTQLIVRDEASDFADAVLALLNSETAREEAAGRSLALAERHNNDADYYRMMDRVLAGPLKVADTTAMPPHWPAERIFVEWSLRLQALNHLARAFLEAEPFDGWALSLLGHDPGPHFGQMIDGVIDHLIRHGDAAILNLEPDIASGLTDRPRARACRDLSDAIRLALGAAGHDIPPPSAVREGGLRVAVHGQLVLHLAADREQTVKVDGVTLALSASNAAGQDDLPLYQADVAASCSRGLRVIDLDVDATADASLPLILSHALPLATETSILGRPAFSGFALHGDGTASLPPLSDGTLNLPALVDGRHSGFVDFVFATGESAISDPLLMLASQPATPMIVRAGAFTLARLLIERDLQAGDFGIYEIALRNSDPHSSLRLVAASSGLVLGPIPTALPVATALTLSRSHVDSAGSMRLMEQAQRAMAAVLRGEPLSEQSLAPLAVFSSPQARRDVLTPLAEQLLQRQSRLGAVEAQRHSPGDVVGDIGAMIDAYHNVAPDRVALLSPALPIEITDASGRGIAAETEALSGDRGWRVALPAADSGHELRIRLGANFELPGHPDAIRISGFHSAEGRYRWTGPTRCSSVTLPIALTHPSRLLIELGRTGENKEERDFAVSCNGTPVLCRLQAGSGGTTLTAELPAVKSPVPCTEIQFCVRHQFQPAPPDKRVLGVVFRSLTLVLSVGGGDTTLADAIIRDPV